LPRAREGGRGGAARGGLLDEVDEEERPAVAGERREEVLEAGGGADHAPAGARPPAPGPVEHRVVTQDRALELLELRARLEPELLDEDAATLAVARERLRLPARPVEREHQLPAQLLSQRLLCDERLELRDEPLVAA